LAGGAEMPKKSSAAVTPGGGRQGSLKKAGGLAKV
jgi:hypothetical protein